MESLKMLLQGARTIAVVGCSDKPWRSSYSIAAFLRDQGYRIYPVNPAIEEVLGVRAYPDLRSVPEPIDIVDVFRRPEFVPEIVRDAIAVGARALWLQSGITHPAAEEEARRAGLEVVSDRCIAVTFRLERVVLEAR